MKKWLGIYESVLRTCGWLGILALCLAAQLPAEAREDSPAFPYELVEGLYYFTDQGMFRETTSSGSTVEFAETLHGAGALDFDGRLAFTFDDVVFEPYLDNLLDLLKFYHVPAVFFLSGTHLGSSSPSVIAHYLNRMIAEGHILGNHTMGHDTLDRGRFSNSPQALAATRQEFIRLEASVDAILGRHYEMSYWRPPFGIRGNSGKTLGERMSLPGRVDDICRQLGRKLILWHINSLDFLMAYDPDSPHYLNAAAASAACLQRIYASRGGVVLFHANPRTPAMVEKVLAALSDPMRVLQGNYRFATVADLLEMKYGSAK